MSGPASDAQSRIAGAACRPDWTFAFENGIAMLKNVTRPQWIAIAIAAIWLVGSAAYFSREHAAEIRHEARMCIRMQADARSNPACAEDGAVRLNLLCVYKDLDCDRLPRDYEAFALKIVKFSVTPILLAWFCYYVAVRLARRRRNAP